MVKKILTACVYYIIVVLVADLAGVLAVTLFDILFIRFDSSALYYAIWLVIGVFSGIIYMGIFRQGESKLQDPVNGIVTVLVAVVMSSLLILAFHLIGEMHTNVAAYDYYVPGHKYVTYTFFITFTAAAFLSWYISAANKTKT
jgi:hypothetical protein